MAEPAFFSPILPGARIEASGEEQSLILPLTFSAPLERVWDYISRPVLLAEWAPFIPTRPLTHAGNVRLRQIEDDGEVGRVRRSQVHSAEPPTHVSLRWGRETLTFDLRQTASGTHLAFTQVMSEPDDAPSFAAGWHLCFEVLGKRLAGQPAKPVLGLPALAHGFLVLHDAYRDYFRTLQD